MTNEDLQKLADEKRWDELSKTISDYLEKIILVWEEIKQILIEKTMGFIGELNAWYEGAQRYYLARDLINRGIPVRIAWFIANHWPEQWLPTLDFNNE